MYEYFFTFTLWKEGVTSENLVNRAKNFTKLKKMIDIFFIFFFIKRMYEYSLEVPQQGTSKVNQ